MTQMRALQYSLLRLIALTKRSLLVPRSNHPKVETKHQSHQKIGMTGRIASSHLRHLRMKATKRAILVNNSVPAEATLRSKSLSPWMGRRHLSWDSMVKLIHAPGARHGVRRANPTKLAYTGI